MRGRRKLLRATHTQKARQGEMATETGEGYLTRRQPLDRECLDLLSAEVKTGDPPGRSLVCRMTVGISERQWTRMRRTAQRDGCGTSSVYESAIWRMADLRVAEPEAFACLIRRQRLSPVEREADVYITQAGRRVVEEVWQDGRRVRPRLSKTSFLNLVWRVAGGAGWYDGCTTTRRRISFRLSPSHAERK